MDPPSPSYPESISTYDPTWNYSPGSDTGSIRSLSSSFHRRDNRRFSDVSGVLPQDAYQSQGGSGSSYRAGARTPDYVPYGDISGLPTPPLSSSLLPRSSSETLRLDTASSLAPSVYLPRSETDDPAMLRMFPSAPSLHPSDPHRSNNAVPQRLPTQLPSLQSGLPPLPYICAFQQKEYGQMILAPPESWTDQTPLYCFIDVHPSCFVPTSYVTSIYRGHASGELVARLEIGASPGEPTLFVGQRLYPLKEVFSNFRKGIVSRLGDRWAWTHEKYKLHWDCRSAVESVCWRERDPERTPIARIKPASAQPPKSMSTRPPTTMLEIYTQSPALIDEIVVSALIVERKRISPTDM